MLNLPKLPLKILDAIERIVRSFDRAGWALDAHRKSDGNWVSSFDLAIERAVRDVVPSEYQIIGEELGGAWPPKGDAIVIDPADGTHNLIGGSPSWGIIVFAVVGGNVQWTLVYFPESSRIRYCFAGSGPAFAVGPHETRELRVSTESRLGEALMMFEGASSQLENHAGIARIRASCARSRQSFSSAWAGALVAGGGLFPSGAAGLVSVQNKLWDNAGTAHLIERAGGKVTDLLGNPWSPIDNYTDLLMTNGRIHEEALRALKG